MSENSSSEDLMAILLAMSGSERRYFRLQLSQRKQDQSAMVALYDHLLEAGRWDEAQIRTRFEGAGFLRQLAVARTRLQQAILGSLRAYDQARSLQAEFSRRLDEIDLLYRRKLLAPCLRQAQAAQRRAQALQLPLFELSALTWCLRVQRQLARPGAAATMHQLHARHAHAAACVAAESQLIQLHDAMLAQLQQSSSQAQAEQIWQQMQTVFPVAELHLDARHTYYYAQGYLALLRQDVAAYWEAQRSVLEAWEALPDRMAMDEERTFRIYVAYTESATQAHQLQEVPRMIQKLRRLLDRSETLRPVERGRILQLELGHLMATGKATEAAALVPEVEEFLQAHRSDLPAVTRQALLGNAISAVFRQGDWAGALRLGPALLSVVAGQNEALAQLVRWTGLVAHYELLNHTAVEQSLRTGTRPQEPLAVLMQELLACHTPAEERTVKRRIAEAAKAQAQHSAAPHLELIALWAEGK